MSQMVKNSACLGGLESLVNLLLANQAPVQG